MIYALFLKRSVIKEKYVLIIAKERKGKWNSTQCYHFGVFPFILSRQRFFVFFLIILYVSENSTYLILS